VQQLRAVRGFVWTAVHGPHADRLALDQADVARAAARLPGLLRAATANLRAGIDADAFLTSDHAGTEPAWWPLASHPARRRYRRAAGQLDRAADEAAEQLRPLQVPRTQTRPGLLLARDLLRPAAERAPDRPVHPALPPSPWQPSPRRSPGR
jgi:hypothetical protein